MARAFDACIFDMDGVLADSMPQHHRAYVSVLQPLGYDIGRREVFLREGMNARHVIAEMLLARGVRLDEEEARRLGQAKQDAFRSLGQPALFPGAEPAVRALRSAGLRLAVATGTTQANVAYLLGPLRDAFDAILADGDYTRSKPDPEPYLLAAQRLGVPPARCVVVENAPLGVRAAVAAGMTCVALPTTVTPEELRAEGAHAIAADLPEAARLILDGQGLKRA